MPDEKPDYKGLKFEPVAYGNGGVAEHYVIRAFLSPNVTESQAADIKASFDQLLTSKLPEGETAPPEGVCSVVRSRSKQCFTIQLNRTVPLDQRGEAMIAATAMTMACENRAGFETGEFLHRIAGGSAESWLRRN